jgi:hypothetical protein
VTRVSLRSRPAGSHPGGGFMNVRVRAPSFSFPLRFRDVSWWASPPSLGPHDPINAHSIQSHALTNIIRGGSNNNSKIHPGEFPTSLLGSNLSRRRVTRFLSQEPTRNPHPSTSV